MDLPLPVFRLSGMELDGGWTVGHLLGWTFDEQGRPVRPPDDNGSGGNFSVGYVVNRGEQTAFLKAIDLSRAMRAAPGDMLNELKKIIDTATFEKSLCALCGERRMDRVVLALATGDIVVGPNLQDRVPYIIFELADGDVRRRMRLVNDGVRAAWIFRALQNAAVGLTQLHSVKVAHQDIKPSNLLHFEKESVFKVGDVGRAIQEGIAVPHAEYGIAGDPTINVSHELTAKASEALAWEKLSIGRWHEVISATTSWQNIEPFSVRPAVMGSFVAMAHLGDGRIGEKFSRLGLIANKGAAVLHNNLAVALAIQGRTDEARAEASNIKPAAESTEEIVNLATN